MKHTSDEWANICRTAYAKWIRTELPALCPVIIGQAGANRTGSRHGTAMFPNPRNTAGFRLFKMTGLSVENYVCGFERFNTISGFPGQSGRGHKFPLKQARKEALRHIIERRLFERPCIIIGKANATAYMGKNLPEPCEWVQRGKQFWAWMPHTSGIVQYWNQDNVQQKVKFLFDTLTDYVPEN